MRQGELKTRALEAELLHHLVCDDERSSSAIVGE
jgi:hypothetical protein